MYLCSIYDRKHNEHVQACFYMNHAEITRNLSIIVNKQDEFNLYADFSEDFDLYILGSFFDGNVVSYDKPEILHFSSYRRS